MFELLLILTAGVLIVGMLVAYDGSRDVLHPLMLIGAMMIFLYVWMPAKLLGAGDLATYFDDDQLIFVQSINLAGVLAFVTGCLSVGVRVPRMQRFEGFISEGTGTRLILGGALVGGLGLAAWLTLIIGSGGLVQAFSKAYSGGWDDSGYVRDGSILLLGGVTLILAAITLHRGKPLYYALLALFTLPWLTQAILTSRRGPTFALISILSIGWYVNRGKRPPIIVAAAVGLAAGWLILFLVSNRSSIYLGSDKEFTTEVTGIVETANTGNEYIYGSGSLLSAVRREKYFWGMRYLAQIAVRPIPSAIWPNKYEDFGVPELLQNAGTGEGIADTMGWEGADGSAPGIVADLWVEFSWIAIPVMAVFGWLVGQCWKRAVTIGLHWSGLYAIVMALSIYLVMQTMEAVIFRMTLLTVPLLLIWRWARNAVPELTEEESREYGSSPMAIERT